MVIGLDQQSRFSGYLGLMLVSIALLCLSFLALVYGQGRYELALKARERSILLAEELRQSSNDLTRLVRSYVMTGNPVFKQQFQAVVGIRDGKIPRPRDYNLAYWDFKAVQPAGSNGGLDIQGEAVPLLELIRRAGVTQAELENFKASKAHSDELVKIEYRAMALVEQDARADPANWDLAIHMLADERFLALKAEVMAPIIQAEQMIARRTQSAVDTAHRLLQISIAALFVFGSLLVGLIFKVRQQLNRIIGCSIPELQRTIARIGGGDFLTPVLVGPENANSVLGWVAQTQRKLAEMDLMHFKSIIDSSDDAIISKTVQGVVSSWNRGAEKIFGYTADEIIGKSMRTIIPDDRQHEEAEILDAIEHGRKVDHFETRRRHRDGHLVDVSATISPIRDRNGRIIGASKIARDISAAKAAAAEIRRLAFYDTLTGLANRRLVHDRLQQALVTAQRSKGSFAVLFIDLDNFKTLNDTRGHEAGDLLLKEAARRLAGCLRESDTVGRFGGDEFIVIVGGVNADQSGSSGWVAPIAEKIISSLGMPYGIGDIEHVCTSSVGVAVYNGQSTTCEQLIQQADAAMYRAKQAGKNCFRIFVA